MAAGGGAESHPQELGSCCRVHGGALAAAGAGHLAGVPAGKTNSTAGMLTATADQPSFNGYHCVSSPLLQSH